MNELFKRITSFVENFAKKHDDAKYGNKRVVLFMLSQPLLLIGVPLNTFFMDSNSEPVVLYFLLGAWFVTLVVTVGLILNKVSFQYALLTTILSFSLELLVEMIVSTLNPTEYNLQIIICDLLLIGSLSVYSMSIYQRILPSILTTLGLLSYTFSMIHTGSEAMYSYFGLFLFVFIMMCAFSEYYTYRWNQLETENKKYHDEEEELLRTLKLNREPIKAYLKLSTSKNISDDITEQLLERLDVGAQKNLVKVMTMYINNLRTKRDYIEQTFPELSATERELVQFILQGKKTSEIVEAWGKSATTISTHRVNIRKKLGLSSNEKLADALMNILKENGHEILN